MKKEAPFWWPNPQALIALILIVSMVALMFVLALRTQPTQDSDMLKMVVGGFITVGFASIINFYFGSSKESANKGDALTKIATGETPVPPSVAVAPAATSAMVDIGKTAAAILVAFIVAGLAFAQPASAAQLSKARAAKPAVCDPLNLIPGCKPAAKPATAPSFTDGPAANIVNTVDGLLSKLESIQNDLVTNVIADVQAADADAGTIVTPATATVAAVVSDPISHACYPAAVQFLQSLPVAKPTTGTLNGIQLFQKKRDFVNQLKAGIPAYLKIGCGALIGDETEILITMLGMVGVTVATGGITGLLPAATLLPALPALTL